MTEGLKQGNWIITCENEGYFIVLADYSTPEVATFMAPMVED